MKDKPKKGRKSDKSITPQNTLEGHARKNKRAESARIDVASSYVVGIDQADIASLSCLRHASRLLGQHPAFLGRYFKGPGNTSRIQYQARAENSFFYSNYIRVLPIARQTNEVSGTEREGFMAGQRNAAAILAAFGAMHLSNMSDGICVFLDVENNPTLSKEYYTGWAAGLVLGGQSSMIDFGDEIRLLRIDPNTHVRFLPCVYAHHNARATWRAPGKAIDDGAECYGSWVVYMDADRFPIWPWRAEFTSPEMPPTVPVVACQRILDHVEDGQSIDFNLANPSHHSWLLPRLVLPAP